MERAGLVLSPVHERPGPHTLSPLTCRLTQSSFPSRELHSRCVPAQLCAVFGLSFLLSFSVFRHTDTHCCLSVAHGIKYSNMQPRCVGGCAVEVCAGASVACAQ